jgi:divalent metal cation (Fe/Co/Zn/Cd) transporter
MASTKQVVASGDCCAGETPCLGKRDEARARNVTLGLRLEVLTVAWNVVEGLVAVLAATAAGSVALLAFGLDSFVECASGLVMVWRLRAERAAVSHEHIESIEHRARRLVAASLFLLAMWVAFDAARTLWHGEHPDFSTVGIVLLTLSMLTMLWLARAKRRVAHALGSRAMVADAFQTTACFWLSVAALGGILLNGALGWWWADPLAAFVIAVLIVREGVDAWRGEQDCC